MAKALIVTLADEVTETLNKKQGGWSISFTAERKYQPKLDLEDTDLVKVLVAIAAWRVAPDNRTDWAHEFDIDLGIMFRASAKAASQATEKFDEVLKLVEDISDFWEMRIGSQRLAISNCPLTAIKFGKGNDQPYMQEQIETLNQITSVISLTFQKLRDPDA